MTVLSRLSVVVAVSFAFQGTAHAAICSFGGDVPAYVGCIASQAWQALEETTAIWAALDETTQLCTGESNPADWLDYSQPGSMYTEVDMSHCGFVDNPTVITSLHGDSAHWTVEGPSSVYNVTPTGFRVYLQDDDVTVDSAYATSRNWRIQFIATED